MLIILFLIFILTYCENISPYFSMRYRIWKKIIKGAIRRNHSDANSSANDYTVVFLGRLLNILNRKGNYIESSELVEIGNIKREETLSLSKDGDSYEIYLHRGCQELSREKISQGILEIIREIQELYNFTFSLSGRLTTEEQEITEDSTEGLSLRERISNKGININPSDTPITVLRKIRDKLNIISTKYKGQDRRPNYNINACLKALEEYCELTQLFYI